MKFPHHVNVKVVLALVCVSIVLTAGLVYVWAQTPSSTFTLAPGVYPGAPSYTVWREGTNYFAKDVNGLIAFSGTNASAVLNSLVASNNRAIFIKDHVILDAPIVVSTANITLFGDGVTSIIDGNGRSTNLIELPNTPDVYGIEICGLEFTNFAGSAIEATVYATLPNSSDIHIHDNRFTNILSSSDAHIIGLRATDVKIERNYFKAEGNYGHYAIYARYANHSIIVDNYIDGTGAGIAFWAYGGVYSFHNIVANNIVCNLWNTSDNHWAILVTSSHSIVEHNTVFNCARDAIVVSSWYGSYSNTITGNSVTNCGTGETGVGIWVHGHYTGSYLEMAYNTVSGNSVFGCVHGIVLTSVNYTTVTGNAVGNCSYHGIYLFNADYSSITGNSVYGCGWGSDVYDGIHVGGSYNTLVGNVATNNTRYDIHLQTVNSANIVVGCSTRPTSSIVGIYDNGTINHVNYSWNSTTWIS